MIENFKYNSEIRVFSGADKVLVKFYSEIGENLYPYTRWALNRAMQLCAVYDWNDIFKKVLVDDYEYQFHMNLTDIFTMSHKSLGKCIGLNFRDEGSKYVVKGNALFLLADSKNYSIVGCEPYNDTRFK